MKTVVVVCVCDTALVGGTAFLNTFFFIIEFKHSCVYVCVCADTTLVGKLLTSQCKTRICQKEDSQSIVSLGLASFPTKNDETVRLAHKLPQVFFARESFPLADEALYLHSLAT